jgi:hypothetical protein
MIQGQPGQKVPQTLSQPMTVQPCHPNYTGSINRRIAVQADQGTKQILSQK